MKFITKSSDLNHEFIDLLDKYPEYFFATAWAGIPVNVCDKLLENSHKIKQLVVGIHFYQTDPVFFKKFLNVNTLRAVLQPSGTFHPKIYLFFESEIKWAMLIGSANFTNAAFSTNTEATLLIESLEADHNVLIEAKKAINLSWNIGKKVDNAFYESYKLLWSKMRLQRKELESEQEVVEILNNGASEFMKMSWKTYVAKFNGLKPNVRKRFEMLESIRGIFASGRSLIQMSEGERRLISGNPNELTLPGADRSGEFGTSGNGQFMNKMIEGNLGISNALDKIPLVGNVTEQNYYEFLDIFLQEADITIGWVSSAARLLAMKRPDVFYNITSANRERFCQTFNITKSHTQSLNNYWPLVVKKIQLSTWYNEADAKNDFERQLRETRAAMLDVLFYG